MVRFPPVALLAFSLCAVILFLALIGQGLPWLSLSAKLVPVAALMAWLAPPRRLYGRLVFAGLAFSLVGDFLLAVPDGYFLAGLVAFLCAHLCYIAAFVGHDRRAQLWRLPLFAAWVGGLYVWLFPNLGAMAVPVGIYCLVITVMMWRASLLPAAAAIGAILFGLSDSTIAVMRFHGAVPFGGAFLILAYWAGQAGIACSARRV
jgi:alkenylglycerophosphocholine hydrolase